MRDRINSAAAEDACPLCGYWRCRCGEVLRATESDPDMDEALRRVRQGGKR